MNTEELMEHAKKISVFHEYINNLKDKGLKWNDDHDYNYDYLITEIVELQNALYLHLGKAIINDK